MESPVLVLLGYPLGKRYISCIVSRHCSNISGISARLREHSEVNSSSLARLRLSALVCCCGFASSVGLTDTVALSRGKRLHDDGGQEQVVVLACLWH